jgi:hypothetical protein
MKAVALYEVLARELPGLSLEWLLTGHGDPYAGRVEPQDVRRSRFLRLTLGAALLPSTLPLPMLDLERLTAHATLDATLVEGCERLLDVHGQLRLTLAPGEVLPMVEAHLLTLRRRLAESIGPVDLRRRMLRVAGLSAVLAAWTCYRLDRRRDARAYLDWAERLGREIGENDVLILVLMLRADLASAIPFYGLNGQPELARRKLDEAVSIATGPARAPLLLRRAQECAYLGLEHESLGDLDEAQAAAACSGRALGLQEPVPIEPYLGICLQMLGRTAEAVEVMTPLVGTGVPLQRSSRPITLAACEAQLGNLDAAMDLLGQAMDVIEEHGLAERARRVAGVRHGYLARWSQEPCVRDLDERLAAIL